MDIISIGICCFVGALPAGSACLWYMCKLKRKRIDRRHIRAAQENGWTYIGKVEFMCIYPIDGGRALKRKTAFFGRDGLKIEYDSRMSYTDRSSILYYQDQTANANQEFRAILSNPKVSMIDHRHSDLGLLWSTIRSHTPALTSVAGRIDNIQYLTGRMRVTRFSVIKSETINTAFTLSYPDIKLGYYSQRNKKEFNQYMKRNLMAAADPSYCLTHYSSYTMVNSASIKDLKKKCDRTDLSYMNFRPQVVFKGREPYIEDGVRALRIGDFEFSEVLPCIHSQDVNFTFKPKKRRNRVARVFMGERRNAEQEVQQREPYKYLSHNRQICKYYTRFADSLLPTFGVNFECDHEAQFSENRQESRNVIREGYNVYVKYFTSDVESESEEYDDISL